MTPCVRRSSVAFPAPGALLGTRVKGLTVTSDDRPVSRADLTDRVTGPTLRSAGWDDGWQAVAAAHRRDTGTPHSLDLGRVLRVDRSGATVLRPDGPVEAGWGPGLRRAARQDPAATPATGDWVLVQSAGPGQPLVVDVLPRRTSVRRLQVGGSSHDQVLVANVDVVAVVEAMAPDLERARIERLLALAWSSGATPLVVLTKADLVPDPQALATEAAQAAPGCEVVVTASVLGEGLEPLRRILRAGRTVVLLGASGVGKSTLLNELVGAEAMRTQDLGAVGKGRHTTVTRELHLVPGGGALVDTPGMRSIGLAGGEDLQTVFPDVEALAVRCRFADCSHGREPGCAVLAAVGTGQLTTRRLASYRKLLREVEYQASRVDARVRRQRQARWKALRQTASRSRP